MMGGQACVLYGGAEFSKDLNLVILVSEQNFAAFSLFLDEVKAEIVAVPKELSSKLLNKGHAIHFRCQSEIAAGLRIDIMSKMRGVDDFEALWSRRTTVTLPLNKDQSFELQVIGLQDLVKAKKTQRDKDWPMIRRLIEANYLTFREKPEENSIKFWFEELRTPQLLIELTKLYKDQAQIYKSKRPAISAALMMDDELIKKELLIEELQERELDRIYWDPLKKELSELRRK